MWVVDGDSRAKRIERLAIVFVSPKTSLKPSTFNVHEDHRLGRSDITSYFRGQLRRLGSIPSMHTNFNIMNELKNCPFCGGRADVAMDLGMMYCHYQIKCLTCGVIAPTNSPNKQDAINKWNTRYADTDLVGAASALIERMEAVYNMIEYQSVWTTYANHGGDYSRGPQWVYEFEAFKTALKNHEQRSE